MQFGQSTKGRKFPAEVMGSDEVRAIMAQTSRRGLCGARDRALIAVMYRGGLRISEALDLLPKDVETSTGVIRVTNGKGGKSRVVAVDAEAVALLEVWLTKRATLELNGWQPIFCTLAGGRMLREQVSRKLKALAAKAGIEKRVHPHALRHSRAMRMVEQAVPLPIVQEAFGHTSLQTTATYVKRIAGDANVIATMRGMKE